MAGIRPAKALPQSTIRCFRGTSRISKFASAAEQFDKVLKASPNDKAAALYLKRCAYYAEHGVPPDWQGVEVLDSK